MARTSIEQKAIEKAETIGRLIGMSQSNVIGCLILLWNRSQDQGLEIVDRQWIDRMALHCVRRKSIKDAFISQLVAMRILDDEANMTYRIKGNKKHIESLKTFKSQTKKAREMKRLKNSNRLREVEKVIHNSVEIPSDEKLWLHNWDGIDELFRENSIKVFSDDTTFGVVEGHSEVIHIDDSKALPVAKVDEKNKQELLEKSSVNRAVDSPVDRKQLQYLCANESESDSSSLNFNKKEKEEKLIEASTNFVYEEKTSVFDQNFDEARYRYMKKFESIIDFEIRPSQMDKLRYSQLIKSGITPSQVLTMIDNYADYKLPQCKPGHYPIHRKFETFLGSPVNWVCKEHLESMADKLKAKRAAAQKAEDAKRDRKIEEDTKSRRLDRLRKQASQALEIEAAIKARANETRTQKQIAVDALGTFVLDIPFSDPKGLQKAGDILNGMNFKF